MALNVAINFDNRYEITSLNDDLRLSSFTTILKDGTSTRLDIEISDKVHPLIPNVYNLAFGPINENNEIDDQVRLHHENHSKTFSTIVFAAFTFLARNSTKLLGIDGSCNARAYMYYRCIQNNHEYLTRYFKIFGVNYYVRILRKKKDEDNANPFDEDDILTIPKLINAKESISHEKLYNYFIFMLK